MSPQPSFEGGVFDRGLPDGRSGATLVAHSDGIEARTPAGATFVIPYDTLSLEIGGANGRMLFMRGHAVECVLFSEAPGLLAAIKVASRGSATRALAAVDEAQKQRRRSRIVWWSAALALIIVLVLAVPPLFRLGVDAAVDSLPLSVDATLGDMAASEIARLGPVLQDDAVAGFAQEIVDRLRPGLPPEFSAVEFKISVVENPQVNAFALPGGRMAILSGLLKKAEDADMIAGVLAHEMMHVRHRHGLRHAVRATGVVSAVALLFGDASGVGGLLAQGAALAALTSYSREHETEADLDGLALMANAGFDPAGMPALFNLLKELAPDGQAPELLAWMASHPRHDERIAALNARIPGLPRGEGKPMTHTLEAAQAALKGD